MQWICNRVHEWDASNNCNMWLKYIFCWAFIRFFFYQQKILQIFVEFSLASKTYYLMLGQKKFNHILYFEIYGGAVTLFLFFLNSFQTRGGIRYCYRNSKRQILICCMIFVTFIYHLHEFKFTMNQVFFNSFQELLTCLLILEVLLKELKGVLKIKCLLLRIQPKINFNSNLLRALLSLSIM